MYWLFCVSVLFFTFSISETKLFEELSKIKWMCANENCTEPISEGHGLNAYFADDLLKVNFNANDKILIFGKPSGSEIHYWLVQAGSKKGIAPVRFVKEDKIIVNKANQVETIFDLSSITLSVNEKPITSKKPIIPSTPQIVVDGTTIASYEEEELEEEIVADDGSGEVLSTNKPLIPPSNPENSLKASVAEAFIESHLPDDVAHKPSGDKTTDNVDVNLDVGNFDTISEIVNNTDELRDNNTQSVDNINVLNVNNESINNSPQATLENNLTINTTDNPDVTSNFSNENLPDPQPTTSTKEAEATIPSVPSIDSNLAPQTEPPTTLPNPDQPASSVPIREETDIISGLENNTLSDTSAFTANPNEELGNNETDSNYKPSDLEIAPTVAVPADKTYSASDLDVRQKGPSLVPTVVSTSSTPNTEYSFHKLYSSHNENNIVSSEGNTDHIASSNSQIDPEHVKHAVSEPLAIDSDSQEAIVDNSVESPVEESTSPELQVTISNQTPIVQEEHVTESQQVDNMVEESKEDKSSVELVPDNDFYEQYGGVEETSNWFSGFSSVMDSIKEMFSKSDIGVDDQHNSLELNMEQNNNVERIHVSQENGDEGGTHCEKELYCPQSKIYSQSADEYVDQGNGVISEMLGGASEFQMSSSTILLLVIISVVVLLFSLGHYYLENLKQDTALISKINTVSAELFFAQKELVSIEDQYRQANESYQKLVSETSNNEVAIEKMRNQLEESKAARKSLEDEIKRLENEIESLVEEGDEMHRMLAESFSEEERTKSLLANISDLKSVLSERLQEIVSLTEQLDKEKQEVELLTISLKKSEERRETTEDKLAKVVNEADSNTLAVTKDFEEKITSLERIIEERSLERTNFEKQICELKGTCESLMVEKELVEKALKKAHGVSSGKSLSEWLETKQIRTDFLAIQKEVEKLNNALEEAKQQGLLLEGKEKELLNEIEVLNNKYESAEKDKIEALTKLQVLSNYFKEKEIQLQEELGTKEAQWLQKQSEDHTIYEQMRSLREENLSYKAQNDALKKEILDQEASFKIQIANEEQKGQENWINLRHTERRLKEVQMEAAHLRSRLTALEANSDSLEEKHKSLEMVNGDVTMGAASPPFMLYPPPDFIPPPPLVSPTRPPPLGRLSSPPLTPPAPLSPFEFYPPPPPSPPPPLRVHKPQPREPHRKQKDSQSSNHSSESTEKPVRRGKR